MRRTVISVGPQDNGRHMSLEDFDLAEAQEGYTYELSRGVVVVSDIPGRPHLAQVNATRRQFAAYDLAHSGRIDTIASGAECKLLLPSFESERHPDLAIYKNPPLSDEDLWATWIADILIEIVSAGSEYRDYVEKREEYWKFGVREYWIIDAYRRELLALRRGKSDWIEHHVRPPKLYKTRLLPGFEFDVAAVFAAAEAVGL
jgi:Uma2 family endonuclease